MSEFNGRIGHLEGIESPWGNAGGVVKTLEDVEQMARTGVGWIEDGSHTLLKRLGNGWNSVTQQRDKKDHDYNPLTGEMHNSLGMPGECLDDVEKEIPERVQISHAHNKAYIFNGAPVSDEPAEESLELIKRAYAAGADGVILNAGCPNVKMPDGEPHEILSKNPLAFGKVLKFIAEAGIPKPIWVRISPQESFGAANVICSYMKASGIVSALLDPNTWIVPMPIKDNGQPLLEVDAKQVGKSGPAMAEDARKETSWAAIALQGSGIDVISSSSIMDAHELKMRLSIKGVKAGTGTTFYYEPQNSWQEDTDKFLTELAA